ncbi:MAG: 4a-hydroxytetrahydrobiopterin dehydratase [Gammaproteobacteria bacterium]|jgi:4a-hydroxytetrahydrobiopterin dehydratase
MSDLSLKHCVPCEGGVDPFDAEQTNEYLTKLDDDWSVSEDGKEIHRDFKFKGFHRTMGFVNAVAWIANNEGHHPDMEVGYNHCHIHFTTHAIGGLSENDFICAAKVDELLPRA